MMIDDRSFYGRFVSNLVQVSDRLLRLMTGPKFKRPGRTAAITWIGCSIRRGTAGK